MYNYRRCLIFAVASKVLCTSSEQMFKKSQSLQCLIILVSLLLACGRAALPRVAGTEDHLVTRGRRIRNSAEGPTQRKQTELEAILSDYVTTSNIQVLTQQKSSGSRIIHYLQLGTLFFLW